LLLNMCFAAPTSDNSLLTLTALRVDQGPFMNSEPGGVRRHICC